MRKTVDITGVAVDRITMSEALEQVVSFLQEDRAHTIYTPNAEIMMDAHRDPELNRILNEADMVIPDGAGVILASRILGRHLPEKVSGIDLVRETFSLDIGRNIRYFFFGSKPGIAEEAARKVMKAYPRAEVAGCRNGYFKPEDEPDIIREINAAQPDILLAALGAPKQENWLDAHRHELRARVCIGVGGTLDVLAGNVQLAPDFFRNHGLEWLYRLCQEPKRYKRMLKLPQYMLLAVGTRAGYMFKDKYR